MVSMNELAIKLDMTLEDCDPYGYDDCGYSVEQAKSDLVEMPYDIINHLLTLINDLMETN